MRVICKTSCDIGLLPGDCEGKQKLKNLNFGGSLLRHKDEKTDFTFINSVGTDSDFEKVTDLGVTTMIEDDGEISQRACQYMVSVLPDFTIY